MKKLQFLKSPLSRNQMKEITGNGSIVFGCSNKCCPTDGKPRCPKLLCPAVVCPQSY